MGRSKANVRRRGASRSGDLGVNSNEPDLHKTQVDQNRGPRWSIHTAEGVPDALVEYAGRAVAVCEPPTKRRKLVVAEEDGGQVDHITVKQSTHEIEFPGTKLVGRGTLVRQNISASINWDYISQHHRTPTSIEIREGKQIVYEASLSGIEDDQEDLILALEIGQRPTSKDTKAQGTLWTEFGISLFNRDGSDYLKLVFTVNWNLTSSPLNVARLSNKTPSMLKVLSSYFPDQHVIKSEWTAQDFYTSVFQPEKDSECPPIQTDEVNSKLYPFQKRAVGWLLAREQGSIPPLALPISFIRAQDANGRPCYVSHLFGLVTTDITPFQDAERSIRGGILAEEMGLGKTLEMIALITIHKRPEQLPLAFDEIAGVTLHPTSATLIITPPSISQQWISECNKHAPSLKIFHYEGIKAHKNLTSVELLEALTAADVVISTYTVLASEIHFTALNPEKSLRTEAKYPRPKSPLVQLSWWRVCIDEAQMIDSGVGNAAVVAKMIPRVNAWCITGTPVRKNVNDLLGLLIFLRHEPYASAKHIWGSLISWHKHEFRKLFGWLALRHSKRSVREELKLPAQRRYVITMPFTPIEEQHYKELFNQMCEDVDLNAEGAPLLDTWNPETKTDTMRKWLVRLRQTALHPEVGGRNRRAFGPKDGPLRTVDEVLKLMISQNDLAIRTDYRAILTSRLKRGQLLENSPRVKEALTIWDDVAREAFVFVAEAREQLQEEITRLFVDPNALGSAGTENSTDKHGKFDIEGTDASMPLVPFRMRLRGALDVLHMAVFFRASAYYQIKSNEDMTQPGTEDFYSLEKLEVEGYEEAKRIRREILEEARHKAERLMNEMAQNPKVHTQTPVFSTTSSTDGIESRRIMDQLDRLATALNKQASLLDKWREQIVQILLRPLVDEDDGVEMTGDEYEDSTKIQDEVYVLLQALQVAIADRHYALTGQQSDLSKTELRLALEHAKMGHGACPEMTMSLLGIRKLHRPAKELGSTRGVVANLRTLATSLRADSEKGSNRAHSELSIVEKQLNTVQKQLTEQTKATAGLEKEIEQFNLLSNNRLDYYRQLQQVSDTVAPFEGPKTEQLELRMIDDEERLQRQLAVAKSKGRYLEHLKTEAENPHQQRICTICKEHIEIGALTVCGHQYCKDCIRTWWRAHHNCPVCKRKLSQTDLHEITYKPQVLSIQSEEIQDVTQQHPSPFKLRKSSIYSEISKSKLAEIKNIELDGPSFTTKVDTLAKHIKWLRDADPGAKSIIYSQFKDFLDVLVQAFQRFKIGFSSIDKPNGIEKFKNDPGVECFLLHSRAHSSGLNLVNASHVFLCEPLLNTALELQAIARVDRIGQHQETSVWLYLVDGTVEESIHQLSVKRRMEHMGQTTKGKAKGLITEELLDKNLEEANSMELQGASLARLLVKGGKGGEMIEKEDLWECLFGGISQRKSNRTDDNRGLMLDQ